MVNKPVGIRAVYYIPETCKNDNEVIQTLDYLNKLKTPGSIKFVYEIEVINKEREEYLKYKTLLILAVKYGIKIKQTQKTKSLYPQLIIYWNGELWRFYPQSRRGEKEITIKDFLDGLSIGEFRGYNIKIKR